MGLGNDSVADNATAKHTFDGRAEDGPVSVVDFHPSGRDFRSGMNHLQFALLFERLEVLVGHDGLVHFGQLEHDQINRVV